MLRLLLDWGGEAVRGAAGAQIIYKLVDSLLHVSHHLVSVATLTFRCFDYNAYLECELVGHLQCPTLPVSSPQTEQGFLNS